MSRGMQQMRLIVMEFGRFTIDSAGGRKDRVRPRHHYAPVRTCYFGTAVGGPPAGSPPWAMKSGVNAALLNGEGNPIDGQHIGGYAIVHRVRF